MINIDLKRDYPTLELLLSTLKHMVSLNDLPILKGVMRSVAIAVKDRWGHSIQEGSKNSRGMLSQSIQIEEKDNGFRIYSTDPKRMAIIEFGRGGWDMKQTHLWGTKTRIATAKTDSPDGRIMAGDKYPYLIIPFRHGTPGTRQNPMPKEIKNLIDRLKRKNQFGISSVAKRISIEKNRYGEDIERKTYQWAVNAHNQSIAAIKHGDERIDLGDTRYSRYRGMVNMQDSGYLTFRIMSAKSRPNSWHNPPVAGKNYLKKSVDFVMPEAEEAFKEALKAEIGV